jgi:hypothetical protein
MKVYHIRCVAISALMSVFIQTSFGQKSNFGNWFVYFGNQAINKNHNKNQLQIVFFNNIPFKINGN